jgi:hypothetical protein
LRKTPFSLVEFNQGVEQDYTLKSDPSKNCNRFNPANPSTSPVQKLVTRPELTPTRSREPCSSFKNGGRAEAAASWIRSADLRVFRAVYVYRRRPRRLCEQASRLDWRVLSQSRDVRAQPLEGKNVVRRVRKISNARIFEPILARNVTRHRLLDEILSFFGGRAQPMMAQLAEAGKLSLDDVRELEKTLKKIA